MSGSVIFNQSELEEALIQSIKKDYIMKLKRRKHDVYVYFTNGKYVICIKFRVSGVTTNFTKKVKKYINETGNDGTDNNGTGDNGTGNIKLYDWYTGTLVNVSVPLWKYWWLLCHKNVAQIKSTPFVKFFIFVNASTLKRIKREGDGFNIIKKVKHPIIKKGSTMDLNNNIINIEKNITIFAIAKQKRDGLCRLLSKKKKETRNKIRNLIKQIQKESIDVYEAVDIILAANISEPIKDKCFNDIL